MKRLYTTPSQDGYYMPAEFAPHHGTLMIWPERPGSWSHGARAARNAFRQIIWKLSEGEEVYVLAGKNVIDNARQMLIDESNKKIALADNSILKPDISRIHIIEWETDDAWARDTGATFVIPRSSACSLANALPTGNLRGIDWQFNAWGGEYDGLYAHWEKDQTVAEKLCQVLDDNSDENSSCDVYDARHFVLEGGSIHTDGEGTLLVTEECLLSLGRNPKMTREEIENELRGYLGISKVIWLPYGIYNDETNGHIDNICCFAAAGEILLAWTEDESDPQYARSQAALRILETEKDAKGRSFVIHKLPIPAIPQTIQEEDLIGFDFEDGEDYRELGERLAASYVNFYIANKSVLLPQFGDENDMVAVDILKKCFPGREIAPIYARDILTGGGNIHCITQQIPKL